MINWITALFKGIFASVIFSVIARIITLIGIVVITLILMWLAYHNGYKEGYTVAETKYEIQIAADNKAAQDKYNQLLLQEQNISNNVVTKYVNKIKYITKKEYIYEKDINNNVPTQYFLSNGWVRVHDLSASGAYDPSNGDAGSTKDLDAKASTITDTEALSVVVQNYSTCEATRTQLIDLIDWINTTKKSINKN